MSPQYQKEIAWRFSDFLFSHPHTTMSTKKQGHFPSVKCTRHPPLHSTLRRPGRFYQDSYTATDIRQKEAHWNWVVGSKISETFCQSKESSDI